MGVVRVLTLRMRKEKLWKDQVLNCHVSYLLTSCRVLDVGARELRWGFCGDVMGVHCGGVMWVLGKCNVDVTERLMEM